MGAKQGDEEIEPLGSDEGDQRKSRSRDTGQKSHWQSKQPSVPNPAEKQTQMLPLKSAQGFTKQRYDMKSVRNQPKKAPIPPVGQALASRDDFEEYFKSLLE